MPWNSLNIEHKKHRDQKLDPIIMIQQVQYSIPHLAQILLNLALAKVIAHSVLMMLFTSITSQLDMVNITRSELASGKTLLSEKQIHGKMILI